MQHDEVGVPREGSVWPGVQWVSRHAYHHFRRGIPLAQACVDAGWSSLSLSLSLS
jgi:hypothetical protein